VDISSWIEAYQAASKSDDPAAIAALFTEDAEYHTGPFEDPWRGRDTIVREWIARGDSGVEWDFRYEVLATEGSRTIVEAWTSYTSPEYPHAFNNVWLIDLDADGRARLFKEWWIEDPATKQ
jgi:ketosteroid isomerase-like protein